MNLHSNVTLKEHLELTETYLRLVRDELSIGIWSPTIKSGYSSDMWSGQAVALYLVPRAMEAHSALQSWTEKNGSVSGLPLWRIWNSYLRGSNLLYRLANYVDALMLLRGEAL